MLFRHAVKSHIMWHHAAAKESKAWTHIAWVHSDLQVQGAVLWSNLANQTACPCPNTSAQAPCNHSQISETGWIVKTSWNMGTWKGLTEPAVAQLIHRHGSATCSIHKVASSKPATCVPSTFWSQQWGHRATCGGVLQQKRSWPRTRKFWWQKDRSCSTVCARQSENEKYLQTSAAWFWETPRLKFLHLLFLQPKSQNNRLTIFICLRFLALYVASQSRRISDGAIYMSCRLRSSWYLLTWSL